MEEINAMPSLCDSTDFGLDDEKFNRKCGKKWLERKPAVIEQFTESTLYRVGDYENGFFFLWEPEIQLVGYYIKYKTKRTHLHGISVTQTALWRSSLTTDVEGLTRHVFFDILLKEYPAVMSDQIQTHAGRRFWVDQMNKALQRGYSVCLVDFAKRTLYNIEDRADLRRLVQAPEDNPWALYSMRHRALRFMIYRKELQNDLQST